MIKIIAIICCPYRLSFQFETKKAEMTSNIKPVGLYYEKKQPNQIEARNQFKTHDEIDRNRF